MAISSTMSTFTSLPPPHPPPKPSPSLPPPPPPHPSHHPIQTPSPPTLPSSNPPPPPSPTPLPPPLPPPSRWHPRCSLDWYLREAPSLLHRQPPSSVLSLHLRVLLRLRELAVRLRCPTRVYVSACWLYHDFFIHHALASYEADDVAVTALFLAGKAEDAPRRLLDVVHAHLHPHSKPADTAQPERNEDSTRDADSPSSPPSAGSPPAPPSHPGSAVIDVSSPPPAVPSKEPAPDASDRRYRAQLLRLESELLLSSDFNFCVAQPTVYVVRGLKEMTRRKRPRGRGRWEGGDGEVGSVVGRGVVEDVALRVEREVVGRRMEDVLCTAMELQLLAMQSGVCLFFSPRAIATACIHLACLHHHIDLHLVAAVCGFTSPLPSPPSPPPSAMEDVAYQVSSPSSSTSASPCSPAYAESPSSPSTCSPASLTSLSSSASTITPTAPATTVPMPPISDDRQPSSLPPPPPWHRALVPDLSDEQLSLLCQRMLPDELSTMQFPSSALFESLRRDFWPFPIRGWTDSKGRMDRELVDLVGVRREYEQLLAVRVKEEEERRAAERYKAEEERRLREQEMREAREKEVRLEEERKAKEAGETQLREEQRRVRERESKARSGDGQPRRPHPSMSDSAVKPRVHDRPDGHHVSFPPVRSDAMPPRRDSHSGEMRLRDDRMPYGPRGRPPAPPLPSSSSSSFRRPLSPPRRPRSPSDSSRSRTSPQSPAGSRYGDRGGDSAKRRRSDYQQPSHLFSTHSNSSHPRGHRRSSSRGRSSDEESDAGSRGGSSRRRRRSPRAYADVREQRR